MSDLSSRLRAVAYGPGDIAEQAADEIDSKGAEIARLKADVARARVREQELADEANRLLDEVKASDKKVFYLTAEVEKGASILRAWQARAAKAETEIAAIDEWTKARAALTHELQESRPGRVRELEDRVMFLDEDNEELRAALTKIKNRRHQNHETVNPSNAFEAFGRLNAEVCAIYDEADAALNRIEQNKRDCFVASDFAPQPGASPLVVQRDGMRSA